MNFLFISLVLMVGGGAGFWFIGTTTAIGQNASAFLAVVSVMAAGILVRLNRGVPSVDWKSVSSDSLNKLLSRLEEIAKSYILTFAIALALIVLIVSCILISPLDFIYKEITIRSISSCFGTLLGLLVSRMFYIVWLDLDIVRLQNAVILSAAAEKEGSEQKTLADDKLEKMRETRITPL